MSFRPFGMRGDRGPIGEQLGVAPLFYEQVKPVAGTMVAEVVAVEAAPVEQPVVEVVPEQQAA